MLCKELARIIRFRNGTQIRLFEKFLRGNFYRSKEGRERGLQFDETRRSRRNAFVVHTTGVEMAR